MLTINILFSVKGSDNRTYSPSLRQPENYLLHTHTHPHTHTHWLYHLVPKSPRQSHFKSSGRVSWQKLKFNHGSKFHLVISCIQESANRGPDSTFAFEANINSLCPELSRGSILKSQNRLYTKHKYQPGSKMVELNQYSSVH